MAYSRALLSRPSAVRRSRTEREPGPSATTREAQYGCRLRSVASPLGPRKSGLPDLRRLTADLGQARDRCLAALARDTRDRRRTNEPLAVVSTNDLKQRNLEGQLPCRHPPKRRRTVPGNRRSHPTSSSRNRSHCRMCGSTAGRSTGWKDARRSRAAPSWCAPTRMAAGSTSRRRPQTSAPACTNTAAERGRCGTGRSTSPISPTAASIARRRMGPRRGR